jgi:hypothetical protein
MSRKLGTSSLAAMFLALAASPAFAGVGIGQTGQGNDQGANSTQSGVNATGGAGGDNSIIGDAAPVLDQNSGNTGVDIEAMGTGDGTMISTGPGATQFNESGTNSLQVATNGDSGAGISSSAPMLVQNSTNLTVSAELMAVTDATVLIGGNAQTSSTAVNSSQMTDVPLHQNSTNLLISAIILA